MVRAISSGNLFPEQVEETPRVEVAPGKLPHDIASSTQGRFRASDGRVFLFSAYPLAGQGGQLAAAETLVLALPRPRAFSVLLAFISPFLIAATIALAISLLIAALLAQSIYRPLARVSEAARGIALGDYGQKIEPEGPKEIKELAEGFNRMTHDIEQSQLRLRHFVADVSHELRSPLTSIHGFAQALLDGTASDDATRTRAAQIIDEEARRLRRQVDELLELSRMQSNQARFAKEPVDLADVLHHCAEVFAIQGKQKGITIDVKCASGLIVVGDADRLEQVFNNLIDNAVKNSASEGTITIAGHADGNLLRAVVTDDGPGIAPDQLPYVFERFYQVTGARTGVGLGLAITREIVIAHGGTIQASSEPGHGARFTVSLPKSGP